MSIRTRLLALIGEASFVGADHFTAQLQTEIGQTLVTSGEGATVTLTADDSGGTFLFDRAAGITYTLPAPAAGLRFRFPVSVSVTSNAHKIVTDVPGTTLFLGSLLNIDTDSSNAVAAWTPNGSSHSAVSMNGTTTGGLVGTDIEVLCVDATHWMVRGVDQGSGTVATPFANS